MVERLSLAIGAAGLVALVVKLVLAASVADLQREVAQRQQKIAASQVLGQVNGRLIQMLAAASVERGDAALRDLLAANGVSFTVNPPPSTASPEEAAP